MIFNFSRDFLLLSHEIFVERQIFVELCEYSTESNILLGSIRFESNLSKFDSNSIR